MERCTVKLARAVNFTARAKLPELSSVLCMQRDRRHVTAVSGTEIVTISDVFYNFEV